MNRSAFAPLLAASLLALAGCDSSSSSSPQETTDAELLDQLFAPPTEAETTLIASQWALRAVQISGASVEDSTALVFSLPKSYAMLGVPASWTEPETVGVRVVSHVVDGNRHYGALIAPVGRGPHPVLVFAHGGDDGIDSLQMSLFLKGMGTLRDSVAIVVPSFRSEPVDILPAQSWLSEGSPSPWDRDIEDMRSLLRVCARLDSKLDTSRVAVVDYSRGGGVALLAAERDPVFKTIATIAAPTSFQGPWVRALADSLLAGDVIDLPGVDYIGANVLHALKEGRIGMDSARRELVRRSAATWVRRLPENVQCHHGGADVTVLPGELARLKDAANAAGKPLDAQTWTGYNHYTVPFAALPALRLYVGSHLLH